MTTVGSPICVGGTHHFHPAPAGDDLSTVGEQSLREDEKTSKDLEVRLFSFLSQKISPSSSSFVFIASSSSFPPPRFLQTS